MTYGCIWLLIVLSATVSAILVGFAYRLAGFPPKSVSVLIVAMFLPPLMNVAGLIGFVLRKRWSLVLLVAANAFIALFIGLGLALEFPTRPYSPRTDVIHMPGAGFFVLVALLHGITAMFTYLWGPRAIAPPES